MADQVTSSLAQAKVLVMEGQKGADGKSPYIGANGNWFVWNGTAWVDTGIPASVDPDDVAQAVEDYLEDHPISAPVQSVNGKTGVVVLDAEDVGALPADTPIPPAPTVDSALSTTSTNPVQNKVITAELNDVKDDLHTAQYDIGEIQDDLVNIPTFNEMDAAIDLKYTKPSGGIPKTDLASDVQTSLGKADTALQQHQSLSGYATETWVGQQIAAIPDELPAVTSTDNGKFLRVVSGAWAAATVPAAESNSFGGGS